MDIDIGFWLTLAVFICGLVWIADRIGHFRKKDNKYLADTVEFFISLFPVFLVVLVIRSFLVEPFTIPSGSMIPTLQVHDFILVNRFAYGIRLPVINTKIIPVDEPKRGDVIVFKYPGNTSVNYIKRVIGLPGDRVEVHDDKVYINGKEVPQKLLRSGREDGIYRAIYEETLGNKEHLMQREARVNPFTGQAEPHSKGGEWVVPKGHYFVMGDNRDNSNDSRYWGTVPEHLILGKAFLIWMHWDPVFSLPDFSRDGPLDKLDEQGAKQ